MSKNILYAGINFDPDIKMKPKRIFTKNDMRRISSNKEVGMGETTMWMILSFVGSGILLAGFLADSTIFQILGLLIGGGSLSIMTWVRKTTMEAIMTAWIVLASVTPIGLCHDVETNKNTVVEMKQIPYEQITENSLRKTNQKVRVGIEGENSKTFFVDGKEYLVEKGNDGKTKVSTIK